MANLRVVAVFIVAAVLYVTLIDSAAVRSEAFSEHLERLAEAGELEKTRIQRAIVTGDSRPLKHICYHQPCGWAVYEPSTFPRQINAFISNTCVCPDEKYSCIRTDDDLSAGAFVYRCRPNATEGDIILKDSL